MFSAVFVFQVFRLFKVVRKIQKSYIKKSRDGTFQNHQSMEGAHHQATRRVPGAAPPWAAPGGLLAALWVLSPPPFRLYLPLVRKPLETEPFFAKPSLFLRRRRFKIGAAWRSCSGPLSEGDTPSGRPSLVMDASRMCRE